MSTTLDTQTQAALFNYLQRLGDDLLVAGHRLSEWCGHAPILEEDMALANMALDCIGQAEALLRLAGEVEGKGRSEDDLAYFRDEREFKNCYLVEQPRGDFGDTIAKHFYFDTYLYYLYEQLKTSSYEPLAAIAAKGVKEIAYHLRHSRSWLLRLGDGTTESHDRIQASINALWTFTGELFEADDVINTLVQAGIAADPEKIKTQWMDLVSQDLAKATLTQPEVTLHQGGGRHGQHSEHLGHMLATMQILARSNPGASW